MNDDDEPFLSSLIPFVVPHNIQEITHPDNQSDLASLRKHVVSHFFATERGLQDVKTNVKFRSYQMVTRTLEFHLPPWLHPNLWHAYRLSAPEIVEALHAFHPYHLWSLCLLWNLNVSSQALKPSYSNSIGVLCQAKANAKKLLSDTIHKRYVPATRGFARTFHREDAHDPRLPVFFVARSMIHTLMQYLPPTEVVQSTPLRHPIPYNRIFLIRGRKYVVFRIDKSQPGHVSRLRKRKPSSVLPPEGKNVVIRQFLLLVRVVSAAVYFFTYGVPSTISLDPLYIMVNDQLFCGVDDRIYVTERKPLSIAPRSLFIKKKKRKKRRLPNPGPGGPKKIARVTQT